MPWLLLPVLAALPFVAVLVALRARAFVPRPVRVAPAPVSVPKQRSLRNLQKLLRIPTVSRIDESEVDLASFDAFIEALAALYPETHAHLTLTRINGYGLLYRWRGADAGPASVIMGHYDTVPADDGSWRYPPFSATIAEEVIWARGSIDDKMSVAAIFEAVEAAVSKGFQPRHDVYLAFGNNEETTGESAEAIAEHLHGSGVRIAFVLDEGGAVVDSGFPGVTTPMAFVGIAEKGTLDLTLSVADPGGHSSTPARSNATSRLARAISRLDSSPFPARVTPPVLAMMTTAGRYATGSLRVVFANIWLFGPMIAAALASRGGEQAALVRTTAVATVLEGSSAPNVLAATARANINIRILPGETVASVVARVARVVSDPAVVIEVLKGNDPSPVSRTDGPGWRLVETVIRQSFPDAVPAPYLMYGATDARWFAPYSDAVYRFSPFRLGDEVRSTMHAPGEHLPVAAYLEGLGFYRRLIARL